MKSKMKLPKIKQEVKDALKNMGFTDYYSNIYIGLLDSGELNAHELSDITQVPYSRIYEVLNEMVKKGMIIKIDGRPSTFIAANPADVFSLLKKRQEDSFEENMGISAPFLNEIFGKKRTTQQVQFTMYEGNKSCTDHIRNLLNSTSKLMQAAILNIDEVFMSIRLNLDFLRTKGVSLQLVVENKFRDAEFISILKRYGTVRFLDKFYQTIVISDKSVGFQSVKSYFNILKPKYKVYAIFGTAHASYITYLTEMFETLWSDAQD